MGGKNSTERKTTIQNKINTVIKTSNETITEIIHSTINNASTEITNEQVAKISANNAIKQGVKAKSLFIGENGSFSQMAEITNEIKALVTIQSDTAIMAQLLTQIESQLKNSIQQNQQAQQTLAFASKVSETEKNAGGPEQMVAKAMEAVEKLGSRLVGQSDEQSETIITTEMGMSIESISKILAKSQESIENNIKAAIKNLSNFQCEALNSINQELEIEDSIKILGKFEQKAAIKNFNECIFNAINGTKIVTDITGLSAQRIENANSQVQTAENDAKVKQEEIKVTENKSAIMETINNAINQLFGTLKMPMIISGIVAVVSIIIGLIIFFIFMNKTTPEERQGMMNTVKDMNNPINNQMNNPNPSY
jgi:hypothetical protein